MHLNPDDLALYVMDEIAASAAREIEAHVQACPACAALLEREARLEVAVYQAAAKPSQPWRSRFVAAALLGAAAAILIVIWPKPKSPTDTSVAVYSAPAQLSDDAPGLGSRTTLIPGAE